MTFTLLPAVDVAGGQAVRLVQALADKLAEEAEPGEPAESAEPPEPTAEPEPAEA